MRPISTFLTLLAVSCLLTVPGIAGDQGPDNKDKGPHKGAKHECGPDCDHGQARGNAHQCAGPDCQECGQQPGSGMHPGMGGNPHGMMMDGRGKGPMRGHRRMQGPDMSDGDWKFLMDHVGQEGRADYSWHPNRLRAAAIEFMTNDVYRLAILPFNDISTIGPLHLDAHHVWAERTLRDTIAGSLLETGILVLPAENVEAAVGELKGYSGLRTRGLNSASSQDYNEDLGEVFNNTFNNGVAPTDLMRSLAEGQVSELRRDRSGSGGSTNATLSNIGTDYHPAELQALAQALDVDGFLLGSIGSWGVSTKGGFFSNLFEKRTGELIVNIYVIDGATGEPIYGNRMTASASENWWSMRAGNLSHRLASDFAGSLMEDLAHPLPPMMIQQIRMRNNMEAGSPSVYRRVYDTGPRTVGDGNIQRWKLYTHHQEPDRREHLADRIEREVQEEREMRERH